MEKKVFRGECSNDHLFRVEFGGDCRNCNNYNECVRKEKIRQKRLKRRIRRIATEVIIAIIFVAIIGALIGNMPIAEAPGKPAYVVELVVVPTSTMPSVIVPEATSVAFESKETVQAETTVETETTAQVIPTISAYEPGEVYYYDLSYEDKVYIAKVVYKEARGEEFEGQVAVAAVVLNRYVSGDSRFETSSIYSVVTQTGQFASISDVTADDLNLVPSCMEAVEAACKGWDPTRIAFSEGAKFFFNPDGDLSEESRIERQGIQTYRIGNHLFHNEMNTL